ncbi:TPA: GerMN domain-containing protein [Candidatus Avigastranaerophilus faecigallinarum]|nr:GerMN domain-containing protein [Candidatus Avigastranaerophilus faecigallinarum]
MSNFSKIVIIILLTLSFFFIKEKWGNNISNLLSSIEGMPKIELPSIKKEDNKKEEIVKKPTEVPTKKEATKDKETVSIYFLALDSNDNGIYKKVQREIPIGQNRLEYAINELLKGPNIVEKSTGAYSEIPKTTKLLKIKQNGNKIIIDFSSDFQYGGGTDSVYSRMMQLIKTALANTENKNIYLYLDGKQVNFIGGEGIMITQPLNENSLEV